MPGIDPDFSTFIMSSRKERRTAKQAEAAAAVPPPPKEPTFAEKAAAALKRYESTRETQRMADVRLVMDFMDTRWMQCAPAFLQHLETNGPNVPFHEDLEIVPAAVAPAVERMISETYAPNHIWSRQTDLDATQTLTVYLGTPEEEDDYISTTTYTTTIDLSSILGKGSKYYTSSNVAKKRVKQLAPGEPRHVYLHTEITTKDKK